ncbi:hypothetical protein LguiB_001552 [Lonicera macranthoides]
MPFDYSLFNPPVKRTPVPAEAQDQATSQTSGDPAPAQATPQTPASAPAQAPDQPSTQAPSPQPCPIPGPPPRPPPVGSLRRSDFPIGFTFGSATSAFQIEGAVNQDGRLPSIWDTFAKEHDLERWDTTVDHYNRYKEDVKIMKNIGLDAYRFSISWSRILPNGSIRAGAVNPKGIAFYNNLINELLSNDIEPVVTLFHWDLPQVLEDEYQGFLDRKIIDDFRDYADICFREFGDRVKNWITFNEPWSFSYGGYAVGALAPGRGYIPPEPKGASIADLLPPSPFSYPPASGRRPRNPPVGNPGTEPYVVSHHQLLAHGAAVKLYREKYQNTYNGNIGITLVTIWTEPYSNKPQDILAAERAQDFWFGWFMDPLTTGDYPLSMRELVGKRLPKFTKEESHLLKGSFDFLGLNYYTANYVEDAHHLFVAEPHYVTDPKVRYHTKRNGRLIGPQGGSKWLFVYPKGIYNLLMYIKNTYKSPQIYITENGLDEENDPNLSLWHCLFDDKRVAYHHDHLHYIKVAIERGAEVNGYFAWSVLDNFEWSSAFSVRFGTTFVDFNNGLARYPKLSSGWLKFLLQGSKYSPKEVA